MSLRDATITNQFYEICACALSKYPDQLISIKAVTLEVAPERRTQQCSPRFRLGGRFWIQVSDTCRQAGRERNVGP